MFFLKFLSDKVISMQSLTIKMMAVIYDLPKQLLLLICSTMRQKYHSYVLK